ncbi:DNA-binding protein [Paraburkholderia dipogonis]|uniref:DNA-binding protein n=1 Tax=Paraburkholderia dipogonis TaxID=1211383 RepID=A0A4Y8MK73_9BURK|nr:HU family DNA-binding protein [Paraburkholderia dipogonis]TFE37866.1 DNA-binding protein [Paraburkholderia dipogonis]
MNRQELIDAVARRTGGSAAAAGEAIVALCNATMGAVTAGGPGLPFGFGMFSLGQRVARAGRSPSTGVEMQTDAARTVKFTDGKALRDAVNAW